MFIHPVSNGPVSITLVSETLMSRVAVTIHAVSHPTQG